MGPQKTPSCCGHREDDTNKILARINAMLYVWAVGDIPALLLNAHILRMMKDTTPRRPASVPSPPRSTVFWVRSGGIRWSSQPSVVVGRPGTYFRGFRFRCFSLREARCDFGLGRPSGLAGCPVYESVALGLFKWLRGKGAAGEVIQLDCGRVIYNLAAVQFQQCNDRE